MKAQGTLTDSYQITFDIDGFPYIVDRSIQDGGKNTGTTPHGMLFGSIASCKIIVAKSYLDHNHIAYEDVEVIANSHITGSKRKERIEIDIEIIVTGARMSEKDIRFMTRIVEKGCTMANILTASDENKVTTKVTSI